MKSVGAFSSILFLNIELDNPKTYGARRQPRLFYLWGHSYEFTRDNNWDLIEEFCELTGGREDIWYATNIEIIDYMDVLNRLQFNATWYYTTCTVQL